MKAISSTTSALDPVAVVEAADASSDMIAELSSIRAAHQSRKSRVSDFVLRRYTSPLTPGALQAASRAHTSRLFNAALAHHEGEGQHGAGHATDPMADLLAAVRPRNGRAGDAFERAKAFAAKR